mmetsp:Transcript_23770/g.34911  ORF Transcript_23770/g.34911 Transcript_23770/m.34911 type:complete len:162 (+) Transcript_23770:37-522(+)
MSDAPLSPESQKFVDDFISSAKSQSSPGGTVDGGTAASDVNTALGAKQAGNAAYKAGRYEVAVALYSKAIELCVDESQRKVYYSNRAAAHFGLKSFAKSRADASTCTTLDDQWEKGWYRKGLAEEGLELYREAEESFRKGVDCAPRDEALQRALQEVKMMI